MPHKPSSFIWYELMTTDPGAAATFYGKVIGWSVGDSGQTDKDYRQWSISGEIVGGLLPLSADAGEQGMRPMWAGYLNVADVDESVAAIKAAGGAVHVPATDIPGVGRFAMVGDPQGAIFYVMTPIGETPSPSFAPGRPGHGGWNELHTTDWRAAFDFYSAQFGLAQSRGDGYGCDGDLSAVQHGWRRGGRHDEQSRLPAADVALLFQRR